MFWGLWESGMSGTVLQPLKLINIGLLNTIEEWVTTVKSRQHKGFNNSVAGVHVSVFINLGDISDVIYMHLLTVHSISWSDQKQLWYLLLCHSPVDRLKLPKHFWWWQDEAIKNSVLSFFSWRLLASIQFWKSVMQFDNLNWAHAASLACTG